MLLFRRMLATVMSMFVLMHNCWPAYRSSCNPSSERVWLTSDNCPVPMTEQRISQLRLGSLGYRKHAVARIKLSRWLTECLTVVNTSLFRQVAVIRYPLYDKDVHVGLVDIIVLPCHVWFVVDLASIYNFPNVLRVCVIEACDWSAAQRLTEGPLGPIISGLAVECTAR